jgi:hypothetical protein
MLRTHGTAYRVPEWCYGWPEAVLLNADTFYSVHLVEVDDHELAAFASLTAPLLGIAWTRGESGIDYHADARGLCKSGIIGAPPKTVEVLRRR